MELTKYQVCVYINNNVKIQKERVLLDKYGETIFERFFNIRVSTHLMCDGNDFDWYISSGTNINRRTEITLSELESILKKK